MGAALVVAFIMSVIACIVPVGVSVVLVVVRFVLVGVDIALVVEGMGVASVLSDRVLELFVSHSKASIIFSWSC